MNGRLLRHLDDYFDAAPRPAARVEHIGPFTLFVREKTGWSYYARPTVGATERLTEAQVEQVRARQRELGVEESFEWIHDLHPTLSGVAEAAGLAVVRHPLLVLARTAEAILPAGFSVRFAGPDDDLAMTMAVAAVGFQHPGTAPGEAGVSKALDAASAQGADDVGNLRDRVRRGLTVTATVMDPSGATVAVGSHQPMNGTSEIVGVATLPAFRRRGIGGALTAELARDARDRGCATVCLSSGDDETARVYERVGFRRVGTCGEAAPPVVDAT